MVQESTFLKHRDLLTNLWNKDYLACLVENYLKKQGMQEKHGFLFLDIDHFRLLNQEFGSICGDQLLEDLAQQLKLVVSPDDFIGRIESDKFVVFLKDIPSRTVALQKAMQLNGLFAYLDTPEHYKVTCCIGFSFYPEDGDEFRTCYEKAKRAIELVKKQGENQIAFFEGDDLKILTGRSDKNNQDLPIDIFRILYEADTIESGLGKALELIGRYYRASRIYIYEKDLLDGGMTNTYGWNNAESSLPRLSYREIAKHLWTTFHDSDHFYYLDFEGLPLYVKEMVDQEKFSALYQYIIRDKSDFRGFFIIEQDQGSEPWSESELDRLSIMGKILSWFLVKKSEHKIHAYDQYMTMISEAVQTRNREKKTILLIEDSRMSRMILQDMLTDTYEVLESFNGKEALEIIENGVTQIDAIILDVIMPVMDGKRFMQILRQKDLLKKIPVMVITGMEEEKIELEILEMGAFDFIKKPFVPGIVKMRIQNAIELYAYKNNLECVIAEQCKKLTRLSKA